MVAKEVKRSRRTNLRIVGGMRPDPSVIKPVTCCSHMPCENGIIKRTKPIRILVL
jgi:hypothetical protein